MKPIGYIATMPWGLRRVFGTPAAVQGSSAPYPKRPACDVTSVNDNLAPSVFSLLLGILAEVHGEHQKQDYRYGKRKR